MCTLLNGDGGGDVQRWDNSTPPIVCDNPAAIGEESPCIRAGAQGARAVHAPATVSTKPAVRTSRKRPRTYRPKHPHLPRRVAQPSSPHSVPSTTVPAPQHSGCVCGRTVGRDVRGERRCCRETPLHSPRPKYASRAHLPPGVEQSNSAAAPSLSVHG